MKYDIFFIYTMNIHGTVQKTIKSDKDMYI